MGTMDLPMVFIDHASRRMLQAAIFGSQTTPAPD